ncbi:unnamed protein product [Durusdinium trenchii]|uniref:phosphoribosylaminoimidazolesuccinocarboxamide synthase n=1 Tax=Durusdinium trenchii TaxID=1381693 RepID=A0ABP0IZ18_9DINO
MAMSMKSMNLTVGEKKEDSDMQVTGEYMTNYLKEMDGDDSQFKDINAAVVPLSTGSSPPRLQPAESILKAEEMNEKTEGEQRSHNQGQDPRVPGPHFARVLCVSAFDYILPNLIPFKGQVLNMISEWAFSQTKDIIPNALIENVDASVVVQKKMKNLNVELIVRGYLWGSMAAAYEKGDREFCGLKLPEGLIRFQKLDKPIFTPTTKAEVGHDENMSMEDMEKLLGKELAQKAMDAAMKLFQRGTELMKKRGLILLDTKYEFGVDEKGVIHVIDEVNTPDSSRMCTIEEYEAKYPKIAAEMKKGEYKTVTDLLKAKPELKMKEFSKQYVRDALLDMGFDPTKDKSAPKLSDEQVVECAFRYMKIYETVTGNSFEFPPKMAPEKRIISNLQKAGMIRGCLAIILDADQSQADSIKKELSKFKIPSQTATLPKDAAAADKLIAEYNKSTEPLILVQCSDTQSGALSSSLQGTLQFSLVALICPAWNYMSTLGLERSPEGRSTVEGRPVRAAVQVFLRNGVLQLLPQRVLQQYIDFEKQGQYSACIKLLESATPGSLNVLSPASMVSGKPLLVETVLQLIVGYSGLCLKNQQGAIAVKLITQVLDNMSLSLRDLHPGHRTVLEAGSADTALSVCYYMPNDVTLADRSQSFFQQASERYLRLGHINRYCKCCLRAAAVLHLQGSKSEAEYYTQQALNKLSDAPVSSLLAVCYHNLAVHTAVQHRIADAVAHVRCPSLVVTVHSTVLA